MRYINNVSKIVHHFFFNLKLLELFEVVALLQAVKHRKNAFERTRTHFGGELRILNGKSLVCPCVKTAQQLILVNKY